MSVLAVMAVENPQGVLTLREAVFNQVDCCKVCTYEFAAPGKQHLSLSLTSSPFRPKVRASRALFRLGHIWSYDATWSELHGALRSVIGTTIR